MENFEKVVEVVSIHQKVRKLPKKYQEMDLAIQSPDEAYKVAKLAMDMIGDIDREVFLVIGLNTKNKVNVVEKAHIGSLNSCIVSPREIFKSLILHNCASFIVAHQHPSFSLVPSSEDINVTERLQRAGEVLGIELLDSIIVAPHSYLSLKEKGYLD